MYLLDTNMLKLFVHQHPGVVQRIAENRQQVWLSSVAAEETLKGCMSDMNKACAPRSGLSLPLAHSDFADALANLRFFPLYVYGDEAEAIYRTFPKAIIRLGPQDCRIAAQDSTMRSNLCELAHGFTVVTRNLSDFEGIGQVAWIGAGSEVSNAPTLFRRALV